MVCTYDVTAGPARMYLGSAGSAGSLFPLTAGGRMRWGGVHGGRMVELVVLGTFVAIKLYGDNSIGEVFWT